MGQLHEILAIEKDAKNKAALIINEGKDTLGKKHEHFAGSIEKYEAFNDADKHDEEVLTTNRELVTTVPKKLAYVFEAMVNAIDITYQKDLTNCKAKGDIIIDGEVIAAGVPAVTLLYLEDQFIQIREVIRSASTLPLGVKWQNDPSQGPDVYISANAEVKLRTRKETNHNVVVPATDRHPAQVVSETKDTPIGKYMITRYSGALSVADKSNKLNNVEKMIAAIKKARSRANQEMVVSGEIARKLISMI